MNPQKIKQVLKRRTIVLAGRTISKLVPLKARMRFRYRLGILDGSVESELRHLHRIPKHHQVAIDVGANNGLYAFKMSQQFAKVYAFEINDDLTSELKSYNPGNIEIIHQGLSSQAGQAILYIPVQDGLPLTGWASLVPGNCPEIGEHIEKPVRIAPLDEFNIQNVSLLKIDVEGHEVEVLKGAVQTLRESRPTVLIEVKPHNKDEVRSFFAALDYRPQALEELCGVAGSTENYIFVPREF